MGHENTKTRTNSYVDPDVKAAADQQRVLTAIQGGKQ